MPSMEYGADEWNEIYFEAIRDGLYLVRDEPALSVGLLSAWLLTSDRKKAISARL